MIQWKSLQTSAGASIPSSPPRLSAQRGVARLQSNLRRSPDGLFSSTLLKYPPRSTSSFAGPRLSFTRCREHEVNVWVCWLAILRSQATSRASRLRASLSWTGGSCSLTTLCGLALVMMLFICRRAMGHGATSQHVKTMILQCVPRDCSCFCLDPSLTIKMILRHFNSSKMQIRC